MSDNALFPEIELTGEPQMIPLPLDAPDWAVVLNSNVGLLFEQVKVIKETHVTILAVVEEVRPEVSGIIAGLQKNPMFRMFVGGKG